ncbi:MAG: Carboxynorspermidine decarboxylase, putative (EC [uncultured Campylobacterales bacterium]|uniref:Carboxynorspermidine/carboxyspermidine decarboxylase n=1 Tax=uncultured Campylobacterales bacterium TaxID=352960 RepID=A0A6S6SEW3_9BACT|nr:MAG: Carboxynorspermidine decarboxylase, putative (EC [uncultured Campylobacterales bacterium]
MQFAQNINTPVYICEEDKLRANLELLQNIEQRSGAKILLALKGFAFSYYGKLVSEYLSGCCCSGLYEAKFANEYFSNDSSEVHTYSVGFKDDDIDEIVSLCHHIVFNSYNQYKKYFDKCKNKKVAIRINPNISLAPTELYNPCGLYSRFGVKIEEFENLVKNDTEFLNNLDGLHFHALCEESAESLYIVLTQVKKDFSKYFKYISYINFGGGHHITKKGYNVELLIKIIQEFKDEFNIDVYLEPGEAVGWQTGVLVASVIDIVHNDIDVAVLDVSAEAHMPDTLAQPYRADVIGGDLKDKKAFNYMLAGNTCLSGDVMGIYSFDKKLKVGDKVIFEDMIHYTIVKNTTFNGIKLPNLGVKDSNNDIKIVKSFDYESYKTRN